MLRIERAKPYRVEWRQVDVSRSTVDDQIGHRFASARCIENAPHAMAGGDGSAVQSSNSTDQWQSVLCDGPIASLPREDLLSAQCG